MDKIAKAQVYHYDPGDDFLRSDGALASEFQPNKLGAIDRGNYNDAFKPPKSGTDEFNGAWIARKSFTLVHVELSDIPDNATLAELVAAHSLGDTDRTFPERPGLVGPDIPAFSNQPSTIQNLFNEDNPDRVATLSLIQPLGEGEEPSSDGKPYKTIYKTTRFLLQQVNESYNEKVQIVETFGDPVAFFYGERARIFQYSGTLFNTSNFSWKNEFLHAYDTYLRGTRARERGAKVFLVYDSVMRGGYLLNASIQQMDSPMDTVVFAFSMWVQTSLTLEARDQRISSSEKFIRDQERKEQDVAAGEQADNQNLLGVPIFYGPGVSVSERAIIRSRVNAAVQADRDPPFLFVIAGAGFGKRNEFNAVQAVAGP